ncbi:MAG TPA: RDD family protein [Opitutaceae bacterium]|jgi:uncharacterized RDD family membrane protein YckC
MFTIIGGDGREYGPASAEQIRQWIAAGRANLDTRVKQAGFDEWKPLAEFPEIVTSPTLEPPPISPAPGSPIPMGFNRPLASIWLRLVAALIDGTLQGICFIPLFAVVGADALLTGIRQLQETHNIGDFYKISGVIAGGSFALLLLLGLALVQLLLLSFRGQTVGKLLVRVRIVRFPDGAPAGFTRAWLLRSVVMTLICEVIPIAGNVIWLADILFIFRPDHRCLHDLLAGTIVVPA